MQDMKNPLMEALKRKKQQAQALAIKIEIEPELETEDGADMGEEAMADEDTAKKDNQAPEGNPVNTDDEAKTKKQMDMGMKDEDMLAAIGADQRDMESGIENQAPKSLMERAKFALIKKAKAKNKA